MKKFVKISLTFVVFSSFVLLQNCKDKDKPEAPPVAKFSFTSDNGFEAPSTVTFTNTSTNATTYEWDFGDGSAKVTTEAPVHTYENTGSYTVTLQAKSGSKSNSATATITIVDATPVAAFTYVSNNNFTTPSEITFTNTSTSAVSYEWDFGDGSDPVTDENPVHTYAATGDYTVTLIATNGAKTDTETADISITPEEPEANFTFVSNNDFHTPSEITFTNTSTSAMSYVWDFGDGSSTSTDENPVHTYATTGSYTVTLTATNETLTNEKTATIEITPFQPVANFTHVSNNGYHAPSIVTFTNTSEHAASYLWDFGDGTATSTAQNPVHTFTAVGSYDVKLTVTNETLTAEKIVTIEITQFEPIANFTHTSNNGYHTPSIVTFTNTSQHASTYLWDFGDGTTSTAQNPAKTYSTTGSYTVKLTATSGALSNEKTAVIQITPFQPVAAFTHTSNNGYIAPSNITFTNTSTNAASVVWDFGDGSPTTTTANPVHSYATPGTYNVTLTATNETLTDVETKTITIAEMAYTGIYKLVSAVISEDVVIDGELYEAGRDVTTDAQALFDVVSCGNPADRAMDFKFTGALAIVCIGPDNETSAGSWSGNSTTETITINFSSPPYPAAFSLTIENVQESGDELLGELVDAALPGALFGLPGTITVSLSLEFEEQ